MSGIIGPVSSNSISLSVSIRPQISTPIVQKISSELNASGRVAVAEQSFQKAMDYISKLLAEKNVQVFTVTNGLGDNRVSIVDGDSGKQIVQLPPEAVINIAQRSKEQNIGWIVNMLL